MPSVTQSQSPTFRPPLDPADDPHRYFPDHTVHLSYGPSRPFLVTSTPGRYKSVLSISFTLVL